MNSRALRMISVSVIACGFLTGLGNGCGGNINSKDSPSAQKSSSNEPPNVDNPSVEPPAVGDPEVLPVVEIANHPPSPNSLQNQTFEFSSNDSAVTFECNVDMKGFETCANPYVIQTAALTSGEHQLVVRGKNAIGKTSPPTPPHTWIVGDVAVTSNSIIETAVKTGKCKSLTTNQIICPDIVYDVLQPGNPAANLKLDLYLQSNPIGKKYPLIIYVHGGGWMIGDRKKKCEPEVIKYVSKGYAVACISYRRTRRIDDVPGEKIPTAIFPAQIEDVKTAVQFLRKNAGTTLNPNRFGAWGSSAGGHLVALLGTTGNDQTFKGRGDPAVSSRVQAVINYCGPSNLDFFITGPMKTSPQFPEAFVGGPTGKTPSILANPAKNLIILQIDPVTWSDQADPPVLSVHMDGDKTVPVQSSRYLHQEFKEAGIESTYIERKGNGHGFVPVHLPQQAEEFLQKHLK